MLIYCEIKGDNLICFISIFSKILYFVNSSVNFFFFFCNREEKISSLKERFLEKNV